MMIESRADALEVIVDGKRQHLAADLTLRFGDATFVLALGITAYLLSKGRTGGPPPDWARSLRMNAFAWRWVQGGETS